MKPSSVVATPTLDELRQYIHATLCALDRLDPQQTPLLQETIRRSGRTCGLYFQVQGPRRMRSFAIWAGEEDRILFYDSAGLRVGETRLSEAPDPMSLAA